MFGRQEHYPMGGSRATKLTDAIADYIISDMVPISGVESAGFRHMLQSFDPRYKVPGRTYFSTEVIPTKYHTLKAFVKSELDTCTSIALTTDFWTSLSNDSYITVTCHFIDNEWKLQERLLLTRAVTGSHNADHVADLLRECATEWGLHDKEPIIITDNARNMTNAAVQLGWDHVGCFAHTLNLSVCRAFKVDALSRILARARKLVGHFRRSPGAAQVLKEKQELLGLPVKKLIQDVPTRWNSAHDMLTRLLEQQAAVCAAVLDPRLPWDVRHNTLSTEEVIIAEAAVELLKPFQTTTTLMCSGTLPTASLILPITNTLVTGNLAADERDITVKAKMKRETRDDLEGRYPETSSTYNLLLLISSMDPRFKALTFVSDEERRQVEDDIVRRCLAREAENNAADTLPAAQEPPRKKAKVDSALAVLFGTDVLDVTRNDDAPPSKEQSVRLELQGYGQEPPIPVTANPLEWWASRQSKYPQLSILARRLLSVPGTSVPAERIFSAAGATVTARRSNLSPDNVDKLLFLHKNSRRVKAD